jgi:hypothetical protein
MRRSELPPLPQFFAAGDITYSPRFHVLIVNHYAFCAV